MPSLKFPDSGTRMVLINGRPAINATGYLYADEALTVPAEVYHDINGEKSTLGVLDGDGRRSVILDAYGEQPDYWGPEDGTAKLWIVVNGVVSAVHADYGRRIDSIDAAIDDGTIVSVGTGAGTVAAGNDSRIVGSAQKAQNLSDLPNPAAARTNLGLGNVNNTSDLNKPISTATATALSGKVDGKIDVGGLQRHADVFQWSSGASVTGSLVVRTNIVLGAPNSMMGFTVSVDELNGNVARGDLGFYSYNAVGPGGTAGYAHQTAWIYYGSHNISVRMAKDAAGKLCIVLDSNTGGFNYPGLRVSEARVRLAAPLDSAFQGWTVSVMSPSAITAEFGTEIVNPTTQRNLATALSNVDNTSDLNKPISTAVQQALNAFGVRADDPRFGTAGTRQAFVNAINAAEAMGPHTIVYIPAGLTIDVGNGLSLAGKSVQIHGAGAGVSFHVGKASTIRASTQTGPVLDYTGYVFPTSFMGRVTPLKNVSIQGSNVSDPTKNNAGIRMKAMASATFSDIAIFHTGGPCLELAQNPGDSVYLCDFERIIMTTPVNARDNDVPYFYANECNGNRFRGFGFRSLTATGNVGPSGAVIIASNSVGDINGNGPWAPRYNLFDAWWYEYLHLSPGSTLFEIAGGLNVIRDFQWWDIMQEPEAIGTGTSYVRFKPSVSPDLGGNVYTGIVPGDQNVTTFTDTGIDVRQSHNRIVGVRGYRKKNVTIASGVDYTYVHLGGSELGSAGTPDVFVNNSAATHNVLIDETNGDEWRNGGWVRLGGVAVVGGPPNVQKFTAGGVWTKPAGAVTVRVTMIGGGAGGGSGRRGAASTARGGGGGASGGTYQVLEIPASLLPNTVTVTVGVGGAGAAAVTADDTNGTAGNPGGHSIFGGFARAWGGLPGGGGTTVGGSGGPANSGGLLTSAAGGAGGVSSAGAFTGNPGQHAQAGAGGGGISAANVAYAGGGHSYSMWSQDAGATNGTAGAVDGAAAGNGGSVTADVPLPGGGGGGGAASITQAAGAGADGGTYGGAGGGGGASLNGFDSGKGGNGKPGMVQVVTYF